LKKKEKAVRIFFYIEKKYRFICFSIFLRQNQKILIHFFSKVKIDFFFLIFEKKRKGSEDIFLYREKI
jgi:hypothetical protein